MRSTLDADCYDVQCEPSDVADDAYVRPNVQTYLFHYCVRDWRNGKYEDDLIGAADAMEAVQKIRKRHCVEANIISLTLVSPCRCRSTAESK